MKVPGDAHPGPVALPARGPRGDAAVLRGTLKRGAHRLKHFSTRILSDSSTACFGQRVWEGFV